ncbi:MAG: glycoside hydrolase family 3 C-terminal domain-containing protein [Clostridia bacterium]|nr:glycoside hydrolase family 3 C-terminal domain-containing protein [Clostridia bacterium]
MAQLKYERFIVKMSMEQKLKLITSTEFYKSSAVGGYEFPVFEICGQPYGESSKGVHATQFPCDAALAASWNPELINEVYAAHGEETCAVNSFGYFNCTNDLNVETYTSEHLLLGKFLAQKIAGLRRGGAYVNFESVPTEDEKLSYYRRTVRDEVFNSSNPSSVIVSDVAEPDVLKKKFKYKDMTFGVVSTIEDALDFLYGGASFLFLSEDIFDALVNKVKTLTNAYIQAHTKYVNEKISEANFARLIRTFKIFDGEIIDRACNDIIDIIFTMREAKENPQEDFRSLRKGESALFDEINHHELALDAARQSAVLIKNEGGILPISRATKLAVMGEYANDLKYKRNYYVTRATSERLPFDVINEYELNTVGFAQGYAMGESGRSDLTDHVITLSGKADCVLVYLAAAKGAQTLPPEQLELVDLLASRHAKIIAVVVCDNNIDMSFADKCAAVLLTYISGQGGAVAALDIITGEVCPSGKLAKPLGVYGANGFIQKYPVGYGLSYTGFTYDNLKVNESGVSFTVKNTGNYDGYAVLQMFVQKKNTESLFAEKLMRGYTKVFVPKGDAVRAKIPFDEMTFSLYDEHKGYYVEGGLYTVSVGESRDSDNLSGILLLKDYEEKQTFKSTVVETSDDGRAVDFSESGLPAEVRASCKKLPFALKLALALIAALYIDGVLLLFGLGNIISQKNLILYIILGVIGVVVNALAVVYICIISKQRKSQKYIHANVVLTEMLDNVEEFTEIAKVRYKEPVDEPKPEDDDEEQDGQEEADASEEALAATYEVKFDDSDSNSVAIADKISFVEMCTNLRDFAHSRGVNLEMTSARVLVAALASCKVVFLTSKNAERLPELVAILNEYYGIETPISAKDEWHSLSDLLWDEGDGEGKYVLSAFSNAVYGAHKAKEQERVLVLDNVNLNNLGSYFCNFIEYANHPTEEFVINFNEENSIRLPNNLTYLLVPQGGAIEGLPTEILNASLIAEVMISKAESTEGEKVEPKAVSHEDFLLMLSEAKEAGYVSERVWKKVDSLAETLSEHEVFAIGNKNLIQMESFTSVLIDCGSDEAEAVTNMFLGKLAYILKNTRAYRQDDGSKKVYEIIEKLFVDEDLTKIKRLFIKAAQV